MIIFDVYMCYIFLCVIGDIDIPCILFVVVVSIDLAVESRISFIKSYL